MLALLGPFAVPTIVLIVAASVLLLIELFIPGFGVCGFCGVAALGAAVLLQFRYGSASVAVWILAIALAVLVIGIIVLVRSLDKGRLSKSFLVLNESVDGKETDGSARRSLIGESGVTETALRPAGIAKIGSERVDVVSAGEFIGPGAAVTVVSVEGARVLVRPKEN